MPIISIAVLVLIQRSTLRAWKKLNSFKFFPSLSKTQVSSTLSLSSSNREAAPGTKFSRLRLQQSVAIADDIMQTIWIKRIMLQFQEVLSIYKIVFWCKLTVAILVWENVQLCFSQKYTLMCRLEGEDVKIQTSDRRLE